MPQIDVENFLLTYRDEKLDKLRSDAEATLLSFAEHYAEEREKEAYQRALKDKLLEQIVSQKDGWWVTILKGALGSLAFAAFISVISIIFSIASPDSNYGKLVQYIISNQQFDITPQVNNKAE